LIFMNVAFASERPVWGGAIEKMELIDAARTADFPAGVVRAGRSLDGDGGGSFEPPHRLIRGRSDLHLRYLGRGGCRSRRARQPVIHAPVLFVLVSSVVFHEWNASVRPRDQVEWGEGKRRCVARADALAR
jgi:hypothetical protein